MTTPTTPTTLGAADGAGLPRREQPRREQPRREQPRRERPRTGVAPSFAGGPVPAAALDLLERAEDGLAAARATTEAGERYVAAHLSALRTAAAVLAVRGRPRRGAVLEVWQVLPRVAPELAEWAAFFAAGAPRRAAVEAGRSGVVSTRDADDLLRDAEAFADVVAGALGLRGVLGLARDGGRVG